ncbi:hypothetical protein YC2023_120863 [Brassica napus]
MISRNSFSLPSSEVEDEEPNAARNVMSLVKENASLFKFNGFSTLNATKRTAL